MVSWFIITKREAVYIYSYVHQLVQKQCDFSM